jgi:RNA polymerase sigma-70 factor (ECF subfamily)
MSPAPNLDEKLVVDDFFEQPSRETFAPLFRLATPRILRYLRLRGCDAALAEDLAQDVMLTVYRQSGQLRERTHFFPWLYRIARNALLQHRRRGAAENAAIDPGAIPERIPARLDDPLTGARFNRWMAALNEAEREALTLRFVEGFQYHEIAALLEVPMGTIQWRVFQARKKLAARFGAAGTGDDETRSE